MLIEVHDGDVLIEGTEAELRSLAKDIKWTAKNGECGECVTGLISEDGVSSFVIRRLDG
jgi:hypothetical protein